ncbi:MAG: DUF2141 domain-containing protein [Bacteroidota bacterium]
MKKLPNCLFIFCFLMSSNWLAAQDQTATLKVNLTNFQENGHIVRVGLCNAAKDWLKTGIQGKNIMVKNGQAVAIFDNLPKGQYAISCYYDINGNGELDTGFLGIPKEPYAFSNNPSTTFGPPKFEKAMIEVSEGEKEITITF